MTKVQLIQNLTEKLGGDVSAVSAAVEAVLDVVAPKGGHLRRCLSDLEEAGGVQCAPGPDSTGPERAVDRLEGGPGRRHSQRTAATMLAAVQEGAYAARLDDEADTAAWAAAAALSLANDIVGQGGPGDLGVPYPATERRGAFARLGKGRRQASDGGAYAAAAHNALALWGRNQPYSGEITISPEGDGKVAVTGGLLETWTGPEGDRTYNREKGFGALLPARALTRATLARVLHGGEAPWIGAPLPIEAEPPNPAAWASVWDAIEASQEEV